jgi:PAS domain S-box-containing protein
MIKHPLHILIVEDNPGDFFLIQELLMESNINQGEVVQAENLEDAIHTIEHSSFDLIFLDLSLPDSSGINTFKAINQYAPMVPIIVMSGLTDTKIALETVRLGAQDYLVKGDFNEKLLEKSVFYSIERKSNLDAIQKSKEKYKQLFDITPVPMMVYDKESLNIILVNNAAIQTYGYSKEEFLKLKFSTLFCPKEQPKLLEALENTSSFAGEWEQKSKDNQPIIVDIITHDYYIENHLANLVVAYDITEKKEAQSKELFHAHIFRNITDSVIVFNPKGIITYWNKGASDIFNYDQEEAIGTPLSFLHNAEEYPPQESLLEHLVEYGEYKSETKRVTKKGKEIWVDIKVNFIYDHDGNIMGILEVGKDITERKKVEELLLIQKKAIEAVGVGITITNPQKEGNPIIFTNPKFLEISGYTQREVIGKKNDFLRGPDTNPQTVNEINKAITEAKPYIGEILNYRKNGEPFWNYIAINPIFDTQGNLINFVKFQQDITEKKKADLELLNKTQELNTFMYRASHDLRGPLASLMGLSELAKRESGSPDAELYLSMISKTSAKLDEILKNLLHLTALKQTEPKIEDFVFNSIINDIISGIKENVSPKPPEIILNFEKQAEIKSDKTILKLILHNLIDNAVKYSKKNSPNSKVEISLVEHADKKQIIISDNGIGIGKDSLQKVFNMFYRGTEASTGSGLGLYTVKSFVEKLHGSVEIKSIENEGTHVTISLPSQY